MSVDVPCRITASFGSSNITGVFSDNEKTVDLSSGEILTRLSCWMDDTGRVILVVRDGVACELRMSATNHIVIPGRLQCPPPPPTVVPPLAGIATSSRAGASGHPPPSPTADPSEDALSKITTLLRSTQSEADALRHSIDASRRWHESFALRVQEELESTWAVNHGPLPQHDAVGAVDKWVVHVTSDNDVLWCPPVHYTLRSETCKDRNWSAPSECRSLRTLDTYLRWLSMSALAKATPAVLRDRQGSMPKPGARQLTARERERFHGCFCVHETSEGVSCAVCNASPMLPESVPGVLPPLPNLPCVTTQGRSQPVQMSYVRTGNHRGYVCHVIDGLCRLASLCL